MEQVIYLGPIVQHVEYNLVVNLLVVFKETDHSIGFIGLIIQLVRFA